LRVKNTNLPLTSLQDQLLLNVIIEELINDKDPEMGGAVQLSGVLRLLIDPENMLSAINKSEKADFLNLFYKQSMHVLIGKISYITCVICNQFYFFNP